MEKVSIFVRVL